MSLHKHTHARTHAQEKVMGSSGVVEVTLNKQEVLVLYLIVQ